MQPTDATGFQRARRPEQREQRRQAILDAAEALLTEMPAADVSLREISRRVGQSKSSVVRYFETREAVFLEILQRARQEWLDDLQARLPAAIGEDASGPALRELTDVWARSLAERTMLCELWSMLAAVLERNVSAASIRAFKLGNREHLTRLAIMIQARLPALTRPAAEELAATSAVVIAGLWPFAQPSPAVLEAIDDPRLSSSRIDFATALSRNLQLVTTGLLHSEPAYSTSTTGG